MRILNNWLTLYIIAPLMVVVLGAITLDLMTDIFIYYCAFETQVIIGIVLLVFLLIVNEYYIWYRDKVKSFASNFRHFKSVKELKPADFGIFTYYEYYIKRESDDEIRGMLRDKDFAFITGKPGLGKTRAAYQAVKDWKKYSVLIPRQDRLEVSKIVFPPFFKKKQIILLIDDLEKFLGKINLDELVYLLRSKAGKLKVIVTCRTGEEYDQVVGEKEMTALFSQCQQHKTKPRLLNNDEGDELAKNVGKTSKQITPDGTPGSIVLNLDAMRKRYLILAKELKKILFLLKLLREARIYEWTEELVSKIAGSDLYQVKGDSSDWNGWLNKLSGDGFIERQDGSISIAHDTYLGDNFIDDYKITDSLLDDFKKALKGLHEIRLFFNLSTCFYHKGKPDDALECLNTYIKKYPDDAVAHYNLGLLLYSLKRYKEAEQAYKAAIRSDPNDAVAHYNLGLLLYNLKRYEEVEQAYKAAIRTDQNDAAAHSNLSNLLERLVRYNEAEQAYKAAIKVKPNLAEAHANLGMLYITLNKTVVAIASLRTARNLFEQQKKPADVKKVDDILKELESNDSSSRA